MKRFVRLIGVLLTLAMVCGTLSGCKSSDYEKAQKLDSEGKFEEARDIYLSLGDYKNSAWLAKFSALKAYLSGDGYTYDHISGENQVHISACNTEDNISMLITFSLTSTWNDGYSTGETNCDISATIPYGMGAENGAYIEGSSTFTGKSEYYTNDVSDNGSGTWDIASYVDGATVPWDEYEHSGISTSSITGRINALDGNGQLGEDKSQKYFSLFVIGIYGLLEESNSGVTMFDLGFLVWQPQ